MVPMQIKHGPANRNKLPPRKVAAYAGLAVGAVVLVCVLVFFLFPGIYQRVPQKPNHKGIHKSVSSILDTDCRRTL